MSFTSVSALPSHVPRTIALLARLSPIGLW